MSLWNIRSGVVVKIGYARISTTDQKLDLQIDALRKAGCEKTFYDVVSGSKSERPGLNDALEYIREGDLLVTWRLDRLGRSLKHLIELINELDRREIGFVSLQESINTTTAGGKLVFHVFGAMAEFERSLIQERTKYGLEAAKARGRNGGRPSVLSDEQIKQLKIMANDKTIPVVEICKTFDVSKSTYYKYAR